MWANHCQIRLCWGALNGFSKPFESFGKFHVMGTLQIDNFKNSLEMYTNVLKIFQILICGKKFTMKCW